MIKNKKKYEYSRHTTIIIVMFIIFGGIISKLINLQILQNEYFINYANEKTVTELVDFAPRGNILDSKGNILATNKQSYILTYTDTDESKNNLTETMTSVFKILDEKGENIKDDFELKVDPFSFEFRADTEEGRRAQELRFKKDRGLDDEIFNKKYKEHKEKTKDKLTVEEQNEIDEELLKITPEQTFNKLLKQYQISPQDDFKTLVNQYKDTKDNGNIDEIFAKIIEKYNVSSDKEEKLKILLQQYKDNYKNIKLRDQKFADLVQFCEVDKLQYSVQDERRFMLVKDALKMQSFSGYKPIIIANNIKQDTAFTFYQKLNSMPGINVEIQPLRYYPYAELGSDFLGYISKISSQNKDKYEERGYDPSYDYVGTTGLEASFEENLKGSKGATIVKLNKQGRVFETLGQRDSYPGQNLQLTIDKDLQEVAEKALDDAMNYFQKVPSSDQAINRRNANRGAVVVEDVNTGKILALASRPGYDPNMFVGGLPTDLYNQYFNQDIAAKGQQYVAKMGLNKSIYDTLFPVETVTANGKEIRKDDKDVFPKPLFNYATRSLIPPGSTFKPLTSIAGLEEGVIDANTYIVDKGIYTENNYTGKCDIYPSSHGSINVIKAIEVSCNYFFYDVGNRLYNKAYNDKKNELISKNQQPANDQIVKAGQDSLAKYAWQFGLGEEQKDGAKNSTGIEIGESFGQVSNYESIKRSFSTSFMRQLNEALLQGRDVMDRRFKPMDILVRDTDSDEVKALKNKFKDIVMGQMKASAFSENGLRNDLTPVLKELTEKSPELKAIGYTKNDIQDIIVAAVYSVLNARSEISTPGNVYSASIGQGFNTFTPVQLANYISTLVNGGNRYKVHLVDKILDPDGNVVKDNKPIVVQKVDLKPNTINIVKEGMRRVAEGDGSTTAAFIKFPIPTGGKTGTATYHNDQHTFGREAYGVYVGFAPYDKPQIAVSAVIFDAGYGGDVAPVVRAVYEKYFEKELAEKYPQYKPTFKFVNDLN